MSKNEFKEILEEILNHSDQILRYFANIQPMPNRQIMISAIVDAMIVVCKSTGLNRADFKDMCQDLINQYDEAYEVKLED